MDEKMRIWMKMNMKLDSQTVCFEPFGLYVVYFTALGLEMN